MPYISDKDRKDVLFNGPTSAGELNFIFTTIAIKYRKTKGLRYQTYNDIIGALERCKLGMYRRATAPRDGKDVLFDGPTPAEELNGIFTIIAVEYLKTKGINDQTFNDIIGALEGCKLEMYRRATAPYEDIKIEENGDVY